MSIVLNGTSGITTILTLQIQRRKGKAEAGQEEAKAHQEDVKAKKDLADLERDIYTRLTETITTELQSRDKQIVSLQNKQNDLLKTIEIQNGNIKHCLISFSTDWLYPTSESKKILIALNSIGADVSFVEIITNNGHDAFLLNEPEFLKSLKGFLDSAYESFKLSH